MNRRNFLRAATGCAVAAVVPTAIRSAVVMVPKKYGMSESVCLWYIKACSKLQLPATVSCTSFPYQDGDLLRKLGVIK